jgi:hypothetical protein
MVLHLYFTFCIKLEQYTAALDDFRVTIVGSRVIVRYKSTNFNLINRLVLTLDIDRVAILHKLPFIVIATKYNELSLAARNNT